MRVEHVLYMIPLKLRALFRRQRVEQELDEELRDHFQRRMEENLARGLSRRRRTAPPGALSGSSNKARRGAGTCAG
jgi:hypothetical protein